MPTEQQKILARERIDDIGSVYWGMHSTLPKGHPVWEPDEIVERVLADYGLCGKVPIDILKKRAQKRVKELG